MLKGRVDSIRRDLAGGLLLCKSKDLALAGSMNEGVLLLEASESSSVSIFDL